MNTTNQIHLTDEHASGYQSEELIVDQIGKTVAISLDRELKHLSPRVLARLENSRAIALSKQKKSSQASSSSTFDLLNLRSSVNWIGMILVTAIVLYFVVDWQSNSRISDIADLDTAILSDSVPPDAYADEGFRVFLKEMIQRKESEKEQADMNKTPVMVEDSAHTVAVKDASQNP
ncbi:DUF3619 family protein [Polynucleobacter kasalickyi]|uniref:DUF3619 family protein n=1 Tax=Polynucleobacter kasalickyi TaxID=1938817 RepID=A0A1W1ZU64_9BURK|nr:DUF3619 family protein [Polynucleobacter kasalickyi]SMC51628.1 Protein of unknown function [Polynucleobacter kasalickyi]